MLKFTITRRSNGQKQLAFVRASHILASYDLPLNVALGILINYCIKDDL
jgi:hypothetical protein